MQAANPQFRVDPSTFVRKAIIRIVLSDLLQEESGAMALQHLGILWIIYEYSDNQNPMTTARLTALTRVTSSRIIQLTERLERLGLIERKRVPASHGKGRTWEYHPGIPKELLSQAVKGLLSRTPGFAALEDVGKDVLPQEFDAQLAIEGLDTQARRKKRGPKPGPRSKRPPRSNSPE